MTGFRERVWAIVRRVPRGRVVSYGGIAAILGRPRAARGVGRALSELPDDTDVPWWRVVNRNGEISIKGVMHGAALQRALLRREGIRFVRGRIDWKLYGWDGSGLPDSLRDAAAAGPEGGPGSASGARPATRAIRPRG